MPLASVVRQAAAVKPTLNRVTQSLTERIVAAVRSQHRDGLGVTQVRLGLPTVNPTSLCRLLFFLVTPLTA